MTASNVRAGHAYVEIAADSSRLGRDLRAAQMQIRGFGDSVRNIGLQLGTLFSGVALSGGILNSAKSFADAGAALDDLSQRSGASVESLGALSLAAKLSDTSIRTAKPTAKAVRLFDGDGLYLEMAPSGGKLRRLKYRFDKKEKRHSSATYCF